VSINDLDPDSLVDEEKAAEILSVAQRTLQTWRAKECGPDFFKLGRRTVRYRVRTLLQWIEKHARKPK
jgi:hypothetical protein